MDNILINIKLNSTSSGRYPESERDNYELGINRPANQFQSFRLGHCRCIPVGDRLYRGVLRDEIEFNRLAGITAADYRIPEYMREEPLPPHNTVFDVPDSELDSIFEAL